VAAVVLLLGASAPRARAADAGAISLAVADAPSHASDPRAAYYLVDTVRPGARVARTLQLTNGSDAPVTVELSVGGAAITKEGFRLDDAHPGDVPTWSRVSPASADLAPRASRSVRVTIAVPEGVPDGERYGIVWASIRQPGANQTVVNRVGVRAYVLVAHDGHERDDVRIDSLRAGRDEDGSALVKVHVTNTGDRAVDIAGTVALDDDAHPDQPVGTVVPGTTVAPGRAGDALVRFDGDVANGPWRAVATLEVNGVRKRGKATITFPVESGTDASASPVVMLRDDRRVPVVAVGIDIALIVAALIGAAQVRRRTSS
jgi:hypothetical protein